MASVPLDRSPNRFSALAEPLDNPTRKKKKPNPNQDIFRELSKTCPTAHNPIFILMSSADNTKPLSQLSPFVVKKSIEVIEINSISQLQDGNLLVLTRIVRIADKFLKAKSFPSLCFNNVKLHDTGSQFGERCNLLASSKARCGRQNNLRNEEPTCYGACTCVYKFTRQIGGKKMYTGQIVLTIDLFQLPDSVEVAWNKVKAQLYIPSKGAIVIRHVITATFHLTIPTKYIRTLCANWAEEHLSSDTSCTKFIQAREILKIKTLEKCNMGEARHKYTMFYNGI